MPEMPNWGTVAWVDLTVENAEALRDFYASVTGWKPEPVDMSGYSDYNMCAPSGTPAAGVCHARGSNAGIPPVWMIYITVPDLAESLKRCRDGGGKVLLEHASGQMAIIEDPAGAVCALYKAQQQ